MLTLALAAAGLLAGCEGLTGLLNPTPASPWAPNPSCGSVQVAAYRVQAATPIGTLEVTVTDAQGAPVASASLLAFRNVPAAPGTATRKALCALMPGMGETGADGKVRIERLMTGPYVVQVASPSGYATASALVEEGKVASLTMKP